MTVQIIQEQQSRAKDGLGKETENQLQWHFILSAEYSMSFSNALLFYCASNVIFTMFKSEYIWGRNSNKSEILTKWSKILIYKFKYSQKKYLIVLAARESFQQILILVY